MYAPRSEPPLETYFAFTESTLTCPQSPPWPPIMLSPGHDLGATSVGLAALAGHWIRWQSGLRSSTPDFGAMVPGLPDSEPSRSTRSHEYLCVHETTRPLRFSVMRSNSDS